MAGFLDDGATGTTACTGIPDDYGVSFLWEAPAAGVYRFRPNFGPNPDEGYTLHVHEPSCPMAIGNELICGTLNDPNPYGVYLGAHELVLVGIDTWDDLPGGVGLTVTPGASCGITLAAGTSVSGRLLRGRDRLRASCAPGAVGPESLFEFRANSAGRYRFTAASLHGTDVVLSLIQPSCDLDQIQELACNDDYVDPDTGITESYAALELDLAANQRVFLLVDSFAPASQNDRASVTATLLPP